MCKYCNKLKEINDLDKKSFKKIVGYWRQRDLKARKLILNLVQLQVFDLSTQARLLAEADEFVNCNWIGK